MTRTTLLVIFSPRYILLFPQLKRLTEILVFAAEKLKFMVSTTEPWMFNLYIKEINESLDQGNILSSEILSLIKRLFIVPFDRDDLNELVMRIWQNIESINLAGRMINFNWVEDDCLSFAKLAEKAFLGSLETRNLVNYLENTNENRNYIMECCKNLQNCEKEAKKIYYSEILKLVTGSENFLSLTRKKNMLEMFIRCTRFSLSVSETARSILSRNL